MKDAKSFNKVFEPSFNNWPIISPIFLFYGTNFGSYTKITIFRIRLKSGYLWTKPYEKYEKIIDPCTGIFCLFCYRSS